MLPNRPMEAIALYGLNRKIHSERCISTCRPAIRWPTPSIRPRPRRTRPIFRDQSALPSMDPVTRLCDLRLSSEVGANPGCSTNHRAQPGKSETILDDPGHFHTNRAAGSSW